MKRKRSRTRTLEEQFERDMRKQLKAFRKKFGRDPGPGDPVFFDATKDVPTPMAETDMEKMLMDALLESGAPPEVIYAHKKTGRIGMQGAMENWPEDARREWEEAIDEYFKLEADAEKGPSS